MGTPIDRQKLLSVGILGRGRTRNRVVDGRRGADAGLDAGQRCKTVTDELGNTVTESANRQDVAIRAPHVQVVAAHTEVHSG